MHYAFMHYSMYKPTNTNLIPYFPYSVLAYVEDAQRFYEGAVNTMEICCIAMRVSVFLYLRTEIVWFCVLNMHSTQSCLYAVVSDANCFCRQSVVLGRVNTRHSNKLLMYRKPKIIIFIPTATGATYHCETGIRGADVYMKIIVVGVKVYHANKAESAHV